MIKKLIIATMVAALTISAFGCAKVGEATGKAVKEIKEMPGEFKEGYNKGRTSTEDEI